MSTATQTKRRLTSDEYLTQERLSPTRHEFFDGEVFETAGSSRVHSLIGVNIIAKLHQALAGSSCEVHGPDLRVYVPATSLFTYPDVSVACPPQFLEKSLLDTLVNPVLLVEVLSESTEAYDRGKKFENFRAIPTLCTYVLVAQDRPHVERYTRQGAGDWLLHEVGPGGQLHLALPCGECQISLTDIYARVF